MNNRLYRLTKADGYFATAVFLNLDLRAGVIRYVNAGHPAPLLFQDGGQIVRLDLKSPAMGLIEGASFRESQAQFLKDDSLLLYTDGATEVTGPDGDDLGEAGIIRLVRDAPAGWQISWLESKLLEASNDIRLPDDLTLIKISRAA
jgi:sigma-B regulation protein RsbU (phosphoserine phosphatase)